MTNKTNHRAITIDQLPIPQSRVEEALHAIIGTLSIDTLPDPQSRIEVLLHYIALNGGTGGGGGLTRPQVQAMINELLKDATFDDATYELIFTQYNGQEQRVSLSSFKQLLDGKAESLVFSLDEEFLQLLGGNNQVLSTIPLMTDQQVKDIKDLFV